MTFYEPSRKKSRLGIIIVLIFAAVAAILFFAVRSCSGTGFFRSAKSSDANYVYQVYPVSVNGIEYFISLDGIFKTTIYERKGGMTMRSGSTDVRLSLHNLSNGELIKREVLGDFHKNNSSIIGARDSIFWLYNTKDGIHGRSVTGLNTIIDQENIISSNSMLSEGLARSNDNLINLNELYAFDKTHNALMVTTISGKNIWLDATSFNTVEAPVTQLPNNDYEDIINKTIEQVSNGLTIDVNQLTQEILQATTNITASFDINHLSDRVVSFDSCTYLFEGSTLRTLKKSGCPQPVSKMTQTENSPFISPNVLSAYNAENKTVINPPFLNSELSIVMHAKKVGEKSELLISGINNKTIQKIFTVPSGIILSNYRSGYKINGAFGNSDTLYIAIDNQLFSINVQSGKLLWKKIIAKNDYYSQIYSIGELKQNGKNYIQVVSSYYTVLSQQGVFVNGRTDYQQLIIEEASGKILKQQDFKNAAPENIPFYLGEVNNKNWFYSNADGLHTRNMPDLSVADKDFNSALKTTGLSSPLVKTTGYNRAYDENFIAIDVHKKQFYFTTENGVHYLYDMNSKKITEIQSPDESFYTNLKMNNPYLNTYYKASHFSMPHEILLSGGDKLKVETNNNTSSIIRIPAKKDDTNKEAVAYNQFIEAQFLVNGISLNKDLIYTDRHYSPVGTSTKEPVFYIFHKNKIAVDAHKIISKYDYAQEKSIWQFDVTSLLGIDGEVSRVYNRKSSLVIIFKTHPDLDDNFSCVSINAATGKMEWMFKF